MMLSSRPTSHSFFFKAPAPTEIYTLSLHDALPISASPPIRPRAQAACPRTRGSGSSARARASGSTERRRSEEHTSELQSRRDLVCRLLLEKKKKNGRNRPLRHVAP